MSKKIKREFKVELESGETLDLVVIRPNPKQTVESQKVYNKTYALGKREGFLMRDELRDELEKRGIWSTEKQADYKIVAERLEENVAKLNKGGLTKKKGKELAIQIKIDRMLVQRYLNDLGSMDDVTIEGYADNARFDYLVSACVLNADGSPYFSSLEDYLERNTEEASVKAAGELAALLNDYDPDYVANLPENKFLKRFGYVNDSYRLVNEEGKLVDTMGRLINEEGDLVNENGEKIDEEGLIIKEVTVDNAEFYDDEEVGPKPEKEPESV